MTANRSVEAFVQEPAIAIVGVSLSGHGFGNLARRVLQEKGYRVCVVHPRAATSAAVDCYPSIGALPPDVHALLVVVPPSQALEVVRQAAGSNIRRVWLQQGAESDAAIGECRRLGLDVVAGECILMFAHPTSYHRVHHWIRRLTGQLPQAA
jgi:predicted CoA-binding protein